MWKWRASTGWMLCALIFVIVASVFQAARHGAFLLWDDNINIATNPHLRDFNWENVRWMFTDFSYMRRYVPLAWLGWNIDHQLFGLTPASAHVGNLLFHALNAALVFLLLRKVLTAWRGEKPGSEGTVAIAATLGALLWAMHPMRVEVVGWASGRMYCQAGFFLLLATLAYFSAVQSHARRRTRVWIAVATAAFGASLLTYPIGLTLVAVLVIIDACVLRRFPAGIGWFERRVRAVWLEKIPFLAVAAAVGAATLAARFDARGLWEPPPTLTQVGIGARIAQACYVWVYYIWKPLFPSGLSPVYTTLLGFNPGAPLFLFSLFAVVALTGLLIWRRRQWPAALALWLAHVCLLAPMTGFAERTHYVNDRYSYLQGVLLALAMAALLARSLEISCRRWMVAAAIVVIGSFVVSSIAQLRIWRDSEALFAYVYHTTSYAPTRADIAFRLGDALRIRGRTAEASRYYRESLRLVSAGSRAAVPHFGLGIIAQSENRAQEAADHFQAAIRLDPEFAEAHNLLGTALATSGRLAEAVAAFREATRLDPMFALAHFNLGLALRDSGDREEASKAFSTALRLQPDLAAARDELARLQTR